MDEIYQLRRQNIILQLEYLDQQRQLNALQTEKLRSILDAIDNEQSKDRAEGQGESYEKFA
ncbi:hypothetical protein [Pseudomonas luteola]|uniref:hypothetical protein n=1 Tax=Pseudomonas luteola TaxID=47886 RepID=UPI0015E34005|nr:hypothetical protein [Pseudomonas zeshuii]MBA1249835.1 hypothetical protein [Pseudomonas zeshuii]